MNTIRVIHCEKDHIVSEFPLPIYGTCSAKINDRNPRYDFSGEMYHAEITFSNWSLGFYLQFAVEISLGG